MAVGEAAETARRTRRASAANPSRPALRNIQGHSHARSSPVGTNNSPSRQRKREVVLPSGSSLPSSQSSEPSHQDNQSRSQTITPGDNGRARGTTTVQVESAQTQAQHDQRQARTDNPTSEPQQIALPAPTPSDPSRPLVHPFNLPAPPGHVAVFDLSDESAMSRPRTGRGGAGRDARDGELEADHYFKSAVEAVRKAKEHNDHCQRLGSQIIELEAEIKAKGSSTPEEHRRLDALYREMMRNAEQEKRVHDDEDIASSLKVIAVAKTNDEPPTVPRGTNFNKGRNPKSRPPILESDVIADSPGPSPSDRINDLKAKKGGKGERSPSVASQRGSGTALKEDEPNRGIQAEKAGQLVIGTEVFYRYPKGSPDEYGVGIQCIIKKVWQDKKPMVYDVQDPEPDASGKQNVHKAQARDLIPIPSSGATLPTFAIGANVFARYPDTDTFYKAKVRGFQKGEYTLRFEGEDDDKEQPVEKRFVFDLKTR